MDINNATLEQIIARIQELEQEVNQMYMDGVFTEEEKARLKVIMPELEELRKLGVV